MKKSKLFFVAIMLSTINCIAQYTKLLEFGITADGATPYGSLISDGTYLYGMTYNGGSGGIGGSGFGSIFKIKPDGTGYSKLYAFNGTTNGSKPAGDLISDGTFLYGMTTGAGASSSNYGNIFKIKPDGTGYTNLYNFNGTTDGVSPWGSLISDGTFLYGMTMGNNTANKGTIFKIKPDGTGYTKLLDFAGISNGSQPYGSLISDGTFLYGMTSSGGTNNLGVIFKIKPDGTGYTKLLDFAGVSNGSDPKGSLISDGTFLYGMTQGGDTTNGGLIFKIKPDGTGYSKLLDFTANNGSQPHGSLFSDGTFLYGMTEWGGSGGIGGTIFKIKPDGTGYAELYNFNNTNRNGNRPHGSLISDGTFLYGMTSEVDGGAGGVIFKYNPYCTPDTFTQSATVCLGNFVTVGTHTYTVPGTYKDTLYRASTCDSTVITNLTVCTGIEDNNVKNNVSVYPNPTNGLFNVQMIKVENVQIKIHNVYAECIYQNISTSSNFQIDLSNQPSGFYFVQLKTEQGITNKKIVISN